jgi:hypothetical protein
MSHTSSGAHLASYSVGTRQFVPGDKETGVKAERSSPSSAEVKYMYCNASTSHMPLFYMLHQKRFPIKAPFLNEIYYILPKQFIVLNKLRNV